ncbi:hypothetical protein [Undibacterium terreum]|uniref:Histone H1-like nucleoprotein HC2 n=1 Tax=Undibacterium terreum TaxID=1224302 RepID=A0A916XI17_9BURK|nr:hypothetical protein [Undibacterium terreum]GGC74977.1 hypothetical protein GCM10011396_22790 [Undibacterium terreum]
MATTPVKKVAVKTKAAVAPAKNIVAAAAKAPVAKAVKPSPAAKAVVKPAVKPVADKAAAKPAAKGVKKPVVAVKPAAAKPAPIILAANKDKAKKPKLVRDSFTMPETEYEVLSQVKKACISAGVEVKKSQLLRIGLVLLKKTDVNALKILIAGLEPLKAGRPKKEK